MRGHWLTLPLEEWSLHAANVEYVGRSTALKIIYVAFNVSVCAFPTEESWILDDDFIVISETMLDGVAK